MQNQSKSQISSMARPISRLLLETECDSWRDSTNIQITVGQNWKNAKISSEGPSKQSQNSSN